MLKQVVAVKSVGLFHDAGPSPLLSRVALFFGENGRGKSTLACILRSCAEGKAATLSARATLDGTSAQSIQLMFVDSAGADEPVQMSSAAWSMPMPNLQVFDADFVSSNVYAGADISTDQRASLLQFALGEQAVSLRKKVDEAASRLVDATGKITTQTAVLKAHAGTMSVESFTQLPEAPAADADIALLEKRIAAAVARDRLLTKKVPEQVAIPKFDAPALFQILAKSLPEIESNAEQAVRDHLAKCSHPNFEHWLAQGDTYVTGDDCPYCGASIKGNDLIKAYRTHFNEAYDDLKTEAAKLEQQLDQQLGDAVVSSLERAFEIAQAHLEGWKGFVDHPPIVFSANEMKSVLLQLRTILQPLARSKARQPLEPIGSSANLTQACDLWTSATSFVTAANTHILEAATAIEAYKTSLAAENIPSLRAAIDTLKMHKLRHTSAVAADVEKLRQLTDAKRARSEEKDAARAALDKLMTSTLGAYQTEINTLLAGFNTQIRIEALGFDYRGGAGLPRSDYQLKVRSREVKLTGGATAAFGNALSEGDKRALAFAFFIARLHQDPQLADRVVVIDDPMCSLDRRRRAATIRVLKVLATKCKQLIVLAHDPYFLQELDDELRNLRPKLVGVLSYCKIIPAANDYSDFGTLSLAAECAAQYENDLAAILGYIDATPGQDRWQVARCLRVLVETSLHRQFPSFIPRGETLGKVIGLIEKSTPPSPLVALHRNVQELRAINDYAKGFHHAEDGTPPTVTSIDEGELRGYCVRARDFVLRG